MHPLDIVPSLSIYPKVELIQVVILSLDANNGLEFFFFLVMTVIVVMMLKDKKR